MLNVRCVSFSQFKLDNNIFKKLVNQLKNMSYFLSFAAMNISFTMYWIF